MDPSDPTSQDSFRRAAWRFVSYPAIFPAMLVFVMWIWWTLPHDPISGISVIKSATSAPLAAPPTTFSGMLPPSKTRWASPFRPTPLANSGAPEIGTLVSEEIRFIILDRGGYTVRRREDQYTMADYDGRYGAMRLELRRTRWGIWAITSDRTEVHISVPIFVVEPAASAAGPRRSARPVSRLPDDQVPALAVAAEPYYQSAGAGDNTDLMVKHLHRLALGLGPESHPVPAGYMIDLASIVAALLCLCSAYRFFTLPWRYFSHRARSRHGKCRKCGYDLAGLVGNICPECGGPIARRAQATTTLPPA